MIRTCGAASVAPRSSHPFKKPGHRAGLLHFRRHPMSINIPTPTFDTGDLLQRWSEYDKRPAELHPANKASLFAALRHAGIDSVVVSFEVSGDSGQTQDSHAQEWQCAR